MEQRETRILVTYQSQTGNTRKVANSIYEALPEPKKLEPIQKMDTLDDYDLIFMGFPVHGSGPNPKAKSYLETLTQGKQIGLFLTHAAPENAPEIPECIQKFCEAAIDAEIIDVFNCQGQLSSIVKMVMRFAPDPQVREWAKMDDSKGQPDTSRLEKATQFAVSTLAKYRSMPQLDQTGE